MIGYADVLSIAGVEAIVIRYIDFLAIDGYADDIAKSESCRVHICCCHIEHGGAKLIIRNNLTLYHRLFYRVVLTSARSQQNDDIDKE